MRRMLAVAAVAIVAAVGVVHAEGGFGMCLRPGLLVNAAQFGYKADNLFVGVGLEFATVGWSSKSTYTESTYSYNFTSKYGVSVFLPQVAAKYYFGTNGEGEVRPYASASLFYTLAGASITTSDGQTTVRDTSAERQMRDALGGNVGGTIAFGGEYLFTPHFSIGGEFGCRMLFGGTSSKYSGMGYSSVSSASLGLGVVYTALGLNFYF